MSRRFHVHLSVDDLDKSISFYSALFGLLPDVIKDDYAKWMLDDPRVNFAISKLGYASGLDHLGLQVETEEDLHRITASMKEADISVIDQRGATCCYARSEKGWVHDPAGIPWEAFLTHGQSTTYGVERDPRRTSNGACCAPPANVSSANA